MPSPNGFPGQGWPIAWQPDLSKDMFWNAAADGTIYLQSDTSVLVAYDASGHQRSNWLGLPDGRSLTPTAIGPDGSMFVVEETRGGNLNAETTVFAFDPDGSARFSRSLTGRNEGVVPTPAGGLYILIVNAGAKDTTSLTLLARDGSTLLTVPILQPIRPPSGNAAVAPDNTLFNLDPADDFATNETSSNLSVYKPGDTQPVQMAVPWTHLTVGADGTVVAWRSHRKWDSGSYQTRIENTTLAVLGTDGKPLAGWPRTISGVVSSPVIGPGGTIFAAQLGGGNAPDRLIALSQNGSVKPGWPVSLPGHVYAESTGLAGPEIPVAPILGSSGSVYLVLTSKTGDSIVAYDSSGKIQVGWPVALPARITPFVAGACTDVCDFYSAPLFAAIPSGGGRLYLHIGNEIAALDEAGEFVAGWSKAATVGGPFYGWFWWARMPDGGLAALAQWDDSSGATQWSLMRWNAAGQPAS